MKSKYLEIKNSKQSQDHLQYEKKSRKKTKPKQSFKVFSGDSNQTEQENKQQGSYNQSSIKLFALKKHSKQNDGSQKRSVKNFFKENMSLKSSGNENQSCKQIATKKLKRQSQRNESQNKINFIGELESYLNELKRSKLGQKQPQTKISNQTISLNKTKLPNKRNAAEITNEGANMWQKQIKKEKSINRNLQKCLIQIQKVLWDRNDKLDLLEDEIRKKSFEKKNSTRKTSQYDKHNLSKTIFFNNDFAKKKCPLPKNTNINLIYHQNYNHLEDVSKISSRKRKEDIYETFSDTEKESETTFKQKDGRRKTEIPMNIEKALQKTLKAKDFLKHKTYKGYRKFQRQNLNDL